MPELKSIYFEILPSPIGDIFVSVDDEGRLTELYTGSWTDKFTPQGIRDATRTRVIASQLDEYFARTRQVFDLEICPCGTEFQRKVWAALVQIPYGETRSYRELAAIVGNPNGSRAVGRANGSNPISIVVPCHRVIGASGDLTGYGGGLPVKRYLLELEGTPPVGTGAPSQPSLLWEFPKDGNPVIERGVNLTER